MPHSFNAPAPARNLNDRSDSNFAGFEHPTANFIYCPNQFFNVCLSSSSRNVVRIVAYLLYRTLGWLDTDGNPIEQNIRVSYSELVTKAGVSRGGIRSAIDNAIAAGYIVCTQQGKPKARGQAGQTASYMLRWDANAEYTTDAKQFRGFYAGEGHRTPIPNAFFHRVVPQERLAVVKVVGTVLRHTVGYQNQFGGRRRMAPLSYSYMQRYAKLRDRSSLSQAIKLAIGKGYVRRISQGVVDANKTVRRPASYAVNWRSEAKTQAIGSKTRPATLDRFNNQTSNGSKTRPADRSKIQTKEKTQEKDTYKQQNTNTVVAAKDNEVFRLLSDAGFDEPTAVMLSENRGVEEIQQQIAWLSCRNPDTNPLGLLRTAIDQKWPEPPAAMEQRKRKQRGVSKRQQAEENERRDAEIAFRKQQQRTRRRQLLPEWHGLSETERSEVEQIAYVRLRSDFDRKRFRNNEDYRLSRSLDELDRRNVNSSLPTAAGTGCRSSVASLATATDSRRTGSRSRSPRLSPLDDSARKWRDSSNDCGI